jgi:heme/copper-type cytochrome/quinol oxidase subunit 2
MLRNHDGSDPLGRWSLIVCILLGGLLVLLPWPYWKDAVDGVWLYITSLGISLYILMFALVAILAFCLSTRNHTAAKSKVSEILFSVAILLTPVLKWCIIATMGLQYFHNLDGLGREILGPIPNMVIDGVLGSVSATLLLLLWLSYRKNNCRHKPLDASTV